MIRPNFSNSLLFLLIIDPRAAKGVKKQRKASYQQSLKRLQELETKIAQYKQKKPRSDLERPPQRGQSIPAGLNRPDPEEEDELDGNVTNLQFHELFFYNAFYQYFRRSRRRNVSSSFS